MKMQRLMLPAILLSVLCSAFAQSPDYQQNLHACLNGWATCDHSMLTAADAARVATAEHAHNLQACLSGWVTCDHSNLTADEAARVAKISPASGYSGPPTVVSGSAENGSYYGEPNKNGVPKTVHVHGYFRRDGTYVRSHYRSAPGTNPARIRIH